MKITITIEDALPWYHPFPSAEEWSKAEQRRQEFERRKLEREFEEQCRDKDGRKISPWEWAFNETKTE
jgi:hypothetical protein